MLEEVKTALRVRNNIFNSEIQDLIDAARADLALSGVSKEKTELDTDPLITRAVKTYCKAHFGYDNPEAERFEKSYQKLKEHLSLAGDYIEPTVV